MSKLAALIALAILVAPATAQTTVSLLIDLPQYSSSGTLNIKSTLQQVASRKGAFHFGSTYEANYQNSAWVSNAYSTYFSHTVAENSCKWSATEPSRGTSSLNSCKAVQSFATGKGNTFRGHNTFWHAQTPSWLPGSVSASDLVNNVIPEHVQAEISGMGSGVTSWDVTNEIVGDSTSNGMSALQCVQNKNDWPTKTSDGSSATLVTDLGFVHSAFSTANKYASSNTRLFINDYSTGANDAKTACQFQILADIVANAGVPYSRLGVGFQTHVSTGYFPSKSDMKSNFAKLAALGAQAAITELDISLTSNTSGYKRLQAAIWGDYVDACLYASNCQEFVNWNLRDDMSWLGASGAGTLFDTSGNPKPAAYEVAARLQRYAAGASEMCATSLGSSSCKATAPSGTSSPTTTAGGSTPTTSASQPTTTASTGGCSTAIYGQCGGQNFQGCTTCASGSTCKYSNPYYSQCL